MANLHIRDANKHSIFFPKAQAAPQGSRLLGQARSEQRESYLRSNQATLTALIPTAAMRQDNFSDIQMQAWRTDSQFPFGAIMQTMLKGLTLLFVLFVTAPPVTAAETFLPQTLRYTILSNGRTAGSEVDVYTPGGHIDCTYEFDDRGRGPKIVAHYVVDGDGLPSRTDLTGNVYLTASSRFLQGQTGRRE